jgi:hypothetical protein
MIISIVLMLIIILSIINLGLKILILLPQLLSIMIISTKSKILVGSSLHHNFHSAYFLSLFLRLISIVLLLPPQSGEAPPQPLERFSTVNYTGDCAGAEVL